MGRYDKYRILTNASDYYKPLREERGVKFIKQYETPKLLNPSRAVRRRITTTKHLWKYGDRLYNLANQYYSDPRYWWVIAWWNGYGTEADIQNGALLYIPLKLDAALTALGVS
jgi:hypothetical protein|tara:strand:- start:77 stop:415 length:339 start_codon:yes stop_codon:yes gene_type:complete